MYELGALLMDRMGGSIDQVMQSSKDRVDRAARELGVRHSAFLKKALDPAVKKALESAERDPKTAKLARGYNAVARELAARLRSRLRLQSRLRCRKMCCPRVVRR